MSNQGNVRRVSFLHFPGQIDTVYTSDLVIFCRKFLSYYILGSPLLKLYKDAVMSQIMYILNMNIIKCILKSLIVVAVGPRRRDLGLNSLPEDWRSRGSNSRTLVYKASGNP